MVKDKQIKELERLLKGLLYSACAYRLGYCNGCGAVMEQSHTKQCPVGEAEKYFKDKEDGGE